VQAKEVEDGKARFSHALVVHPGRIVVLRRNKKGNLSNARDRQVTTQVLLSHGLRRFREEGSRRDRGFSRPKRPTPKRETPVRARPPRPSSSHRPCPQMPPHERTVVPMYSHRQGFWRFESPLSRVCLSPLSGRSGPTRTGVFLFSDSRFWRGKPLSLRIRSFPSNTRLRGPCHLLSSYHTIVVHFLLCCNTQI